MHRHSRAADGHNSPIGLCGRLAVTLLVAVVVGVGAGVPASGATRSATAAGTPESPAAPVAVDSTDIASGAVTKAASGAGVTETVAVPSAPVGRVNVADGTTTLVIGLQESVISSTASDISSTPRTERAVSVEFASDTKASAKTACAGQDIIDSQVANCVRGLADPNDLEGTGAVISYDSGPDGTGSVGGLAIIPASVSPTKQTLIATAPELRPFAKGGSSGPNAIITTDTSGRRVSTQYVAGVAPGPICPTRWADGLSSNFNGATCTTPLDRVGERYTPYPSPITLTDLAIGIGDIELTPDGTRILATNVHDGFLYTGPLATNGFLNKIWTRPKFATTTEWRPYGMSSYGGSTVVTWSQLGPNDQMLSFAVASYDSVKDTWKTLVDPTTAATAGDSVSFGFLTAAEIDANAKMLVTFTNVLHRATSIGYQDAATSPVYQLASVGVDHWTSNIAGSSKFRGYSIDGTKNPSFGRMTTDPITGQTIVTTIDPLRYYSGGLTWYNTDGTNGGREMLSWRGEGPGGYRTGPNTVDDRLYLTDPDLLVKPSNSATPWLDTFAFGKNGGLGDLEIVASLATIGNRVWEDTDVNGLQDLGEASIPGVTLEILDERGAAIVDPVRGGPAVVVTDGDGQWVATINSDRVYQVRVGASNWQPGGVFGPGGTHANWKVTVPGVGTDPAVDSNADPISHFLLGPTGRRFLAGVVDFSFDAGFNNGVTPPEAHACVQIQLDVLGIDGDWHDANSPATAALVDINRTKTVYRPTVINCGTDPLKNVVVTTVIAGAIQVIVGNLAVGERRIMGVIEATPQQISATGTAIGIGVESGEIVESVDPAQVKYSPPPTPLPETGRNEIGSLLVASTLLASGIVLTLLQRRRNRRGLRRW